MNRFYTSSDVTSRLHNTLVMTRYIDQLSRSLSVEYKQYGVDVQCQIPLYVATKMSPVKGDSPFIPSPEEYAKAAIRSIGYEPRCAPYWRHSIQWFLASLMPDSALNLWRLRVGFLDKVSELVSGREMRRELCWEKRNSAEQPWALPENKWLSYTVIFFVFLPGLV